VPTPARPLAALAAIALMEGVGLVGYAVFLLVEAVRLGATGPSDVSSVPAIALQIALFVIFGAGLLWVARGWWASRRWARAPFLLAQLMALVIGIPLAQSEGSERLVGIVLSLMAAVGLVLTFTPAVMRALEED
jgi:hypothetical protein